MKLTRWLDRFVFAAVLIAALQLPVLSDQYRQFLAGYVASLNDTIAQWQLLADEFQLGSVDALISHFEKNPDEVVRADAAVKRETLSDLSEKRDALALFSTDNLFRQSVYMFAPANRESLHQVFNNFQPGVPLNPISVIYAIVIAILIEGVLLAPVWAIKRYRRRKSAKHTTKKANA